MNKSEISRIISTKYLRLRKWSLLEYYLPVILFSTMPIIFLIAIIKSTIENNTVVYNKVISDISYPIVFLLIAIILFALKRRELKFKTIDLKVSKKDFDKAVELTQRDLNWEIYEKNSKYIMAFTKNKFGGSSETIRIIKQHNQILINSICNPFSFPFSVIKNKNIETLNLNIIKTIEKRLKKHETFNNHSTFSFNELQK